MATNASHALSALGDPTRQAIFERLIGRRLSVGEIAAGLPVSRPAVSQHLKVLKDAGLVRAQPAGTRRLYEVDQAGLASLRDYLDSFWARSLERFRDEAERRGPAHG